MAEALSQFDTFDVYGGSRTEANQAITQHLKDKFKPYGIDVDTVNIIDISLDEKTTQTINNKIQRQQEVEAAKLEAEKQAVENEKQIALVQAEAEQKRIKAEAEAQAELIRAEATAEANRLISESLTQELLNLEYINKWDGALSKIQGGESTSAIITPDVLK